MQKTIWNIIILELICWTLNQISSYIIFPWSLEKSSGPIIFGAFATPRTNHLHCRSRNLRPQSCRRDDGNKALYWRVDHWNIVGFFHWENGDLWWVHSFKMVIYSVYSELSMENGDVPHFAGNVYQGVQIANLRFLDTLRNWLATW